VAINILAIFIIYLYRGDLVDLGWRAFGPISTFLFLFLIGIHYCFGSQKWKNLSYGLVFIFEVTACSSIYTSIADRDNAFLNYIFMALLFSAISTLSVVNDRLEKLEN